MATKKTKDKGIDRWTSNGYGIKIISTPKQKPKDKKRGK